MKSKARSIALASAVKIYESSGIRCILLRLSDITAQPTFESSFDPSVYKDEHKKDSKHKEMLNLLCIVYMGYDI